MKSICVAKDFYIASRNDTVLNGLRHSLRILAVALTCFVEPMTAGAEDTISPLPKHPLATKNIHPPGKVDVPSNLRFCVKDPTTLPGLVMDEVNAELIGEWQYSTHTPPYVGCGYLHDQNDEKGEKQVIYRFQVAKAGRYEVRISHCYNARRSKTTAVMISHARGRTSVMVNQQLKPEIGSLWKSLGDYRFRPGKINSVIISNKGATDGYVIADAVQIIKLGNPRERDN